MQVDPGLGPICLLLVVCLLVGINVGLQRPFEARLQDAWSTISVAGIHQRGSGGVAFPARTDDYSKFKFQRGAATL